LQTGGVAAELLEIRIANGDGSPRTVELQPHGIVFGEANSLPREHQARRLSVSISCIANGVFSHWRPFPRSLVRLPLAEIW
jgi:hypothetical protein